MVNDLMNDGPRWRMLAPTAAPARANTAARYHQRNQVGSSPLFGLGKGLVLVDGAITYLLSREGDSRSTVARCEPIGTALWNGPCPVLAESTTRSAHEIGGGSAATAI